MKLQHATQVAVYLDRGEGDRTKVGRLALKDRQILFEFDRAFVQSGIELSPVHLPLGPGVTVGNPALMGGLMGLFDDSLPDGWGGFLIDRRARELGLSAATLTPLDHLTLVGARTMGALVYEPAVQMDDPGAIDLAHLAKETEAVISGATGADLERLIAIGGSPKGARPKVLIQIAESGDLRVGAKSILSGYTAWLVKFRSHGDDKYAAALEHAYFEMAAAAGIQVPRTRVLGRTAKNPGYFAIERFDRHGDKRIHTHTVGGLLHLPHGYPGLDYRDLLQVTRQLTRDEAAVAEMYRRACFNVLAHNRDDHSRNFAFLLDETNSWSVSPAFDLTFSEGPGGEHTTLVAGEGRAPTREHLRALAKALDVRHEAAIFDDVLGAVGRFKRFADEAGVPRKLRDRVARTHGRGT